MVVISEVVLRVVRGFFIAIAYFAMVAIFQVPDSAELVRFAEMLALLPFLWIEAVPALFLGCLAANIYGGLGPLDITLGSTATLLAAILTSFAKNPILAALSPVVVNGLIVGSYISFLTDMPRLTSILYVMCGEAFVCFVLGIPLVKLLQRICAILKA